MNWKDRYLSKIAHTGEFSKNVEPLEWEQSKGEWSSPNSQHTGFSANRDGGGAHIHPDGHWGVDFDYRHGTSGATVHGKAENMEQAKGEVEKFLYHDYSNHGMKGHSNIGVEHHWQMGPKGNQFGGGGGNVLVPQMRCPGCEKDNWHPKDNPDNNVSEMEFKSYPNGQIKKMHDDDGNILSTNKETK